MADPKPDVPATPAGDIATTFTFRNRLHGVDGAGMIWRRTVDKVGWESDGMTLPDPNDGPTATPT